jgi:hypothetical protein
VLDCEVYTDFRTFPDGMRKGRKAFLHVEEIIGILEEIEGSEILAVSRLVLDFIVQILGNVMRSFLLL